MESIEDINIEENIQERVDIASPVKESEEQGKGKIKVSEETEQEVSQHLSDSDDRHSWQMLAPINPSLAGMCSISFIMASLWICGILITKANFNTEILPLLQKETSLFV